MSEGNPIRYDLSWRRRNVFALLVLCVLAATALGVRLFQRQRPAGEPLAVDPDRVSLASEQIDPNTASVASLRRLPGIGPVTAQAIVAYRTAHEPNAFTKPTDLAKVHDIGAGIVARISPYLKFAPSRRDDDGT